MLIRRIRLCAAVLALATATSAPALTAHAATTRVCTVVGTLEGVLFSQSTFDPGYEWGIAASGTCTGPKGQPFPAMVTGGTFPTCGAPTLTGINQLPRFLVDVWVNNPLSRKRFTQEWAFVKLNEGRYKVKVSWAEYVPSCIIAGVGNQYGVGQMVRTPAVETAQPGHVTSVVGVAFTFTP